MASEFVDFSGNWAGHCQMGDFGKSSSKVILQQEGELITVNGQEFSLIHPTVTVFEGEYEGSRYIETTTYEWHWNSERTEIITNARWEGAYTDRPERWSGKGEGVIRFEGETLVTTRYFEGKSEICRYERAPGNPSSLSRTSSSPLD